MASDGVCYAQSIYNCNGIYIEASGLTVCIDTNTCYPRINEFHGETIKKYYKKKGKTGGK